MRSPLSVSHAAARWCVAAVPLFCASLPALAFATLAWRYSAYRSVATGLGALAAAVFLAGCALACRNRIGDRLHRVRLADDALHVEHGLGERLVPLSLVRDVRVRDVFPLELVTLRLADDAPLSFGFTHRNLLTRLRSPMLAELLAKLPDASIRERAPRLGGDAAVLPWWARCPELLAMPAAAALGVLCAASGPLAATLWPAAFAFPPWPLSLLICGVGLGTGTIAFLVLRSWRTPPDVRLWKGVLVVRRSRRGRLVERCHPLDGVAGVRYSRAIGRDRRVCLFAIELRGVLSSRALRITFPAHSSDSVLQTLRWPGAERAE
ncbi:hypothetical protein [Lysobacter arvi]|uniref:PH domain-containing protein n=1 Tax=Lysobacter arvi TaxID=3038776 RepID=A0ABU1CEL6_9GAMM|nr:hypothetical protein [Lysobacter arvi]MDR0183174.1 hypothetical protein [Lysobacter arvi]